MNTKIAWTWDWQFYQSLAFVIPVLLLDVEWSHLKKRWKSRYFEEVEKWICKLYEKNFSKKSIQCVRIWLVQSASLLIDQNGMHIHKLLSNKLCLQHVLFCHLVHILRDKLWSQFLVVPSNLEYLCEEEGGSDWSSSVNFQSDGQPRVFFLHQLLVNQF